MKLFREAIHVARTADAKELRKFGFIFAFLLIGLFYLLFPWLRGKGLGPPPVLWVGVALAAFALVAPRALRPVFLVASVVGAGMGAVNNRILLSLCFFLILLPIAKLMWLFSKNDPMRRRLDPDSDTYRIPCSGRDLVKNKEKAF